jgi:hypothetical protein
MTPQTAHSFVVENTLAVSKLLPAFGHLLGKPCMVFNVRIGKNKASFLPLRRRRVAPAPARRPRAARRDTMLGAKAASWRKA